MIRVTLQPAFVLHQRPFRDTSVLVDFMTQDHGRITAVARGVKTKKSKRRGLLMPFVPLLVSWSGRTDLVTLGSVEPNGSSYPLSGDALLSGFYLNELLMRLLHHHDAHPSVFQAYQRAIHDLHQSDGIQPTLRIFEKNLLADIGYGLQLGRDADGAPIEQTADYSFEPGRGLVRCKIARDDRPRFSGRSLLALRDEALSDREALRDAKLLMRQAFEPLLGRKPLKTRELFVV